MPAAKTDFEEFSDVFAELVCTCQEYVRKVHDGERSVVSLRDVVRCITVFRWFAEHLYKNEEQLGWYEKFWLSSAKLVVGFGCVPC